MTNEKLRFQMLAGIITEGEYAAVINKEIEEEDKASLNESMIGGIVGIGAINQIPATPKTDYEMAFEHFLGERYEVKPNRERDDIKEDETSDMEDEVEAEVSMNEEEVEEGKENIEIINIPQEYSALRNILGDKSSSNDIIKMYNERVVPEMDTISLEVYEDGYFWNKVMDDIMVDTILSQLNSTLS